MWDNPCGYLHSYDLKTSLFHEIIRPSENPDENLLFNTSNEDNAEAKQWAYRILTKLQHFVATINKYLIF